jgi:hypothetical protein
VVWVTRFFSLFHCSRLVKASARFFILLGSVFHSSRLGFSFFSARFFILLGSVSHSSRLGFSFFSARFFILLGSVFGEGGEQFSFVIWFGSSSGCRRRLEGDLMWALTGRFQWVKVSVFLLLSVLFFLLSVFFLIFLLFARVYLVVPQLVARVYAAIILLFALNFTSGN